MVELWPVDLGDNAARIPVGHIRIIRRNRIFLDGVGVVPPEHLAQIALEVGDCGIRNIEFAVACKIWMEGESQKPAFVEIMILGHDLVADVQKRCGHQIAVFVDDLDATKLFNHELAVVTGWLDHRQRRVQASYVGLQIDFQRACGRDRPHRDESRQGQPL